MILNNVNKIVKIIFILKFNKKILNSLIFFISIYFNILSYLINKY